MNKNNVQDIPRDCRTVEQDVIINLSLIELNSGLKVADNQEIYYIQAFSAGFAPPTELMLSIITFMR